MKGPLNKHAFVKRRLGRTKGMGRAAGTGSNLRAGQCRLRLRGGDLRRSSSGGLLRERSLFGAGSRVHRAGRPPAAGVRTSRGGDDTSDSKTLPEYSRDPHAMEGAARCMRVFAGCECGAGPAAAETTAGLAGMRCGMRGRLRLMRRVLRTVRNAAHPRTFRTLVNLDYRDTPRVDCRDAARFG
jgi:hypothetical protein